MSDKDTSTAEETPDVISYYIETTDGMFRVNVPTTWSLQVDHTRQGSVIASFTDEKENDRLLYTGVQSIRDSSAHIQELTPAETQPEGTEGITTYEWVDRNTHVPISRYTQEAISTAARRRRRILLEDTIDDEGIYDAGLDF